MSRAFQRRISTHVCEYFYRTGNLNRSSKFIDFFKNCYTLLKIFWLISDSTCDPQMSRDPYPLVNHVAYSTAGATVVRLTYGYTPKDEGDEYIKQAELVMGAFSLASTPGAFLVDTFPICECNNQFPQLP
jgi:hypothetical protein